MSEHRLISPDSLGQEEDKTLSTNQEVMFQHLEETWERPQVLAGLP